MTDTADLSLVLGCTAVRSPLAIVLVGFVVTAGCIGGRAPADGVAPEASVPPEATALDLTPPHVFTTPYGGFEPSIDVAPDGTVYVAAARLIRPPVGARTSSHLWYSPDAGSTWSELASPLGIHGLMPGLEGDAAVDSRGRYYLADIHLADTSLSRWSPGPNGPTWDWSRPVLPSASPIDDRPFLTATGDGVLYLLINKGGTKEELGHEVPPAPGSALAGDPSGPIWLYVSRDAGLTWSLPLSVGEDAFCQGGPDPTDPSRALYACFDVGQRDVPVKVWRASDFGAALELVVEFPLERGANYLSPVATIDEGGRGYAAWVDDYVEWSFRVEIAWVDPEPGVVRLAVQNGSAWEVRDLTPFEGHFGMLHAVSGAAGAVALSFYATTDLTPDEATEWYPYLLKGRAVGTPDEQWATVRLVDEPLSVGTNPPRDIQQVALGPDGRAHAIFHRYRPASGPVTTLENTSDVLYVAEAP